MIALRLAGGHDEIIALRFGVIQQVFQFPDLVAAQCHAAQVIALDLHIGAQFFADVRQAIQRGREQAKRFFIKMIHDLFSRGI